MENPTSSKQITARILLTIYVIISSSVIFVTSDINQDKKECSNQLSEFTTCLPFVSGKAKSPTATCCLNMKKEIDKTRKCLCMLVRDRNDPGLGFAMNATLALILPSVCHAPGNASDCPALLKLPPNSTDAQVFHQFGAATTTTTTNSSPITGSSSRSSESVKARKWMERGMVCGVSLWLLISL